MDFRGLTLRRKSKAHRRPRILRRDTSSSHAKIAAGDHHNGHDNGAAPHKLLDMQLRQHEHDGGGGEDTKAKSTTTNNRTFSRTTATTAAADASPSTLRFRSKDGKTPDAAGESHKGSAVTTTKELVRKRRNSSVRISQPPHVSPLASLSGAGHAGGVSEVAPVTGDLPDGNRPWKTIPVDSFALAKPGLDVNQYITTLLSDATIESIKQHKLDLQALQDRTSSNLQTSSHRNYKQFIIITKEAQKLDKELASLRSLISHLSFVLEHSGGLLKQLPSPVAGSATTAWAAVGEHPTTATQEEVSSPPPTSPVTAAQRQSNRTSLSGLTSLHTSQMHALWRAVEGSQKLLPAISGRRVLLEVDGWVKLNSATWRPKRDEVRIVLLSDRLLVAVRKMEKKPRGFGWDRVLNNGQESPGKDKHGGAAFVVDECWPLEKITVSDVFNEGRNEGRREGVRSTRESADQNNRSEDAKNIKPSHLLDDSYYSETIDILVGEKSHPFRPGPRSSVTKEVFLAAYRSARADLIRAQASQTEALRREAEEKRARSSRRPLSAETRTRLLQLKDNINLHMNGMNITAGVSTPFLPALSGHSSVPVSQDGEVRLAQSKSGVFLEIQGKQESMRWINARLDDLDSAIAVQKFEDAVAGIEELREVISTTKIKTDPGNALHTITDPARKLMKQKVNARAKTLMKMLIGTLTDTRFFRGTIKTRIAWLRRLGFEDETVEAYLRARTELIEQRTRHCDNPAAAAAAAGGSIQQHVFQMSYILFTLLKNTISIFRASFSRPFTSVVIVWANGHVCKYNQWLSEALRHVQDRHVNGNIDDSHEHDGVLKECISIVKENAAVLKDEGVELPVAHTTARVDGSSSGFSDAKG